MEQEKKIRVLLAKPGLDGHDKGILVVGLALRDAGMEVIYLGRHQKPQEIANAAVQEDVDVVGLSFLTDAHRTLAPKVVGLLREMGANDVPVIVGGFIPPEDIPFLKDAGIEDVLGSGTRLDAIVKVIREKVRKKSCAQKL